MVAPKHIYKKDCDDCEKRYQPIRPYQIICPKCKKKRRSIVTKRLKAEGTIGRKMIKSVTRK